MESTNQLLKKAVFLNENDRIGLFIFIPFEHKTHQSYQIEQKKIDIFNDFVAFLNFFLALLKLNRIETVFVFECRGASQWRNMKQKLF